MYFHIFGYSMQFNMEDIVLHLKEKFYFSLSSKNVRFALKNVLFDGKSKF